MRFFCLMLEKVIENNLNVGIQLVLGNKKSTCISIIEDKEEKIYVFDNGMEFTKSNIISSIEKCQNDKKEWKIG